MKKVLIQRVYDQNSIVDLDRDVSEMFDDAGGVCMPEEFEVEVTIVLHTGKVPHILPDTARILDELHDAIRDFGEYTFGDKGPSEVMDIDGIVCRLQERSPEIVATIINELMNTKDEEHYGATILGEWLADSLEDWEELWAVPLMQEIFS